MPSRIAAVSVLVLSLTVPAFAQTSNVVIQPDMRLFAMMAALNAAGFDIEFGSQYHPAREAVRKFAKDVDPDLLARLKDFYRINKGNQTDEAQLAKYISLAVSLTDPPPLGLSTREELIPPDARAIASFADLLREFYQQAHISRQWIDLKPQYDRAINQLGPQLREVLLHSDAYLRVPFGGFSSRTLAIYVELAAPVNTVNVRSYQDNYYVVLGDSAIPRLDDVRHAYLHFHLDNLVAANLTKFEAGSGSGLLSLVTKEEGVDPAYTKEFHVLATESLIRAVELRMDRVPAARAKESIDAYYRSGLLLTPYFYEALELFDQQQAGIRDSFTQIARGVQLKNEQLRFQQTFHNIPIPQKAVSAPEVPKAPPTPPPNPTRDLLKEGEAALNSGNNEKARVAFEKVLSDFDRSNGAALYGLALIASKKDDSDEAKQYFERAIRSISIESSMKVWAYIFLARIFDLECHRERAIEYYQQAVKVGDNTRNAQSAAWEGVQKPYGNACKQAPE